MQIHEINSLIGSTLANVVIKPGYTVKHFPRFEGDLVEIREESGSLCWRGYAFESDFVFQFEQQIAHYFSPKAPEAIEAEQTASRAANLRLTALFMQANGFQGNEMFLDGFTRAEVEQEIAAIDLELAQLEAVTLLETARMLAGNGPTLCAELDGSEVVIFIENGRDVTRKPYDNDAAALVVFEQLEKVITNDSAAAIIRVTTSGGMTLIARSSRVMVVDGGGMSAVWDMRHGLIRNPAFVYSVRPDDIKAVNYGA
ncbi:hypothetical protein SLP22_0078 [Salmonella phage BAU.Micro_SLP-22]|nr:hypothetical protein SLP22_00003 [Salmonella phage BAU.Micro_SLP-22]